MIKTTTHVVEIVSLRDGHVTFLSSELTSVRKNLTLANTLNTSSCTVKTDQDIREYKFWQARRDSNPQHPVLETGALAVRATGLQDTQFSNSNSATWFPCAKYEHDRNGNTS